MPNPANPQSWNRYAYVGNSPTNYTDPSGHLRIQDGDQRDRFSPYLFGQYEPEEPDEDDEIIDDGSGRDDDREYPDVPVDPAVTIGPKPPIIGPPPPGPYCSAPSTKASIDWEHTFKNWREYCGYIDMFEPGPLTGTNINPVSAYVHSVRQFVALNPGLIYNDWLRPTILVALAAPVIATTYDYTYDQITNTGPYSNLPPRVIESPRQAIHFGVSVIIIISLIPYLPPPP